MRQLVGTIGMLAIILCAAGTASAQTVSIQAEMLKDWTDLRATMDRIAGAMPEDKFTFKSTPAQRDFGQQVMHVATVNARFLGMVGSKAAAPKIDPVSFPVK